MTILLRKHYLQKEKNYNYDTLVVYTKHSIKFIIHSIIIL